MKGRKVIALRRRSFVDKIKCINGKLECLDISTRLSFPKLKYQFQCVMGPQTVFLPENCQATQYRAS